MKKNHSRWQHISRATASFCAFFLATFAPTSARAACVTATAGNVWLNTALSAVQTHTFTAYYDATPSASPINAMVGLSKGAPTAYTGFATLVRFNPTGQIDARNGGAFAAASVIPYAAGHTYHFRVAINVATHTYSIYVTPPGGSELTVGVNYAFRSEQNKVTQLDHWGVHVDPSNGGSLTVCNFSIGVPTAPVFSPAPGTYTGTQSVTITSTDATAIYYTTNGTTPTTASTLYTGAVSLPLGTTTLKAIAVNPNGSSAVTTGVYILNPPAPLTPVFSPAGGTFTSAQSVTITSAGATAIYYTTDGTAPTTASTHYIVPVAIANNTVLQAIGVNSGGNSPVASVTFTILPPAPSFSPTPSTYTNVTTFSVTISDAASSTIYYTTDGSTPTTSSTPYTAPVALPIGTTTLSAIAVTANGSSAVTSGTYILTPPPPSTPVFSPAGGTFTSAQSVTITSAGATAIYYTTDGTAPTTSSTLYTGAVTVSNNTVLQAIGVNSGGNSPVASVTFTILPPAPSFSPTPSTYTNVTTFSVTISDAASSTIYYTTDGSTPTTSSTPYTAPVALPIGTTTLSAIAVTANGSSIVTAGTYILTPPPPQTPIFSPPGGSFTSGQSVTITSVGADSIYYTTDGSTPTTSSTLYTGAVTIANNTVLNAIGVNSGGNSPVGTASFTILPPGPTFSPAPGTFTNVTTVSVTIGGTGGTTIYFTTDGSTPTTASTLYSAPVSLPIGTTTLSAIAVTANGSSTITSGTYILTPPPPQTPIFSPPGGTYTSPQSVTITSVGATAIYYTTDGATPTTSSPDSMLYTTAQPIPANMVLKAIGVNTGGSSPVGTASFTILPPGPTFSPAPGTFTNVTTVSVTIGGTGGTTIYFTTDGSTPTTASTLYSAPVSLPIGTTTLSAIAVTANGSSTVTVGTYILTPPPPQTPIFSPAGGSFTSGQSVSITSLGADSIYYTTNGSTPTTASTHYTGALSIANNTVLNAIGVNSGGNSPIASASYTILASAPIFSPASGTYTSVQVVTITSATSGASIRYTTDGSIPTETNGLLLSNGGTVSIGVSTTLQAIAFETGLTDSLVTNGLYTINLPPAVAPIFSPGGGTYFSAQNVTISSATSGASIRYTTDGSTPTETNGTLYSSPINIGNTTMLKAIAYATGIASDSPVTSGLYTIAISPAVVLNVLYDFTSSNNGGIGPRAGLVQGSDGNFYGTAYQGGNSNYGTIFKTTPASVSTTLFSFNQANGAYPLAPLVSSSDGNFYGTAYYGGSGGYGTVFRITPAGSLTTLASFNGTNGASPVGLIQGSDGNFYGTTNGSVFNNGTVFKITPAGVLTALASFNGTNGRYPVAGLVQGSDGNFYGTTKYGGISNAGTVFKITPAGVLTTMVSFNGSNGFQPMAGLVQGSDGNFYGTTSEGGVGNGVVFKMTPEGTLTTLVTFTGTNGSSPDAALIQGSDGNFYGTTASGGSTNNGTIFKMTPAGVLTTFASFDGANGAYPVASLVQGSDGNFYGTTQYGGKFSDGVIFQLILPPTIVTPTFSPPPGSYSSVQSVTISSLTPNVSFAYTTDGTTPTESNGLVTHGYLLSGGQTVFIGGGNVTLKAIAFGYGLPDSAVATGLYTILPPVTPTFSPPPGSYSSVQSVTISSLTPNVSFAYTTDGTTPTESNGLVTHGYLLSGGQQVFIGGGNVTLKAIAFGYGLPDSAVATGLYTILPPVTPTFSPPPGSYSSVQSVTISSLTPNVSFAYTTDGTTPTESNGLVTHGYLLSGGQTVFIGGGNVTLKAIAFGYGLPDSAVAMGLYIVTNTPTVATPVFSPGAGTYPSAQSVSITTFTSGATIRYTIDGSIPTETNGAIYSGPVTISTTTTLQAIAYATGLADSPVTSGLFAINPPAAAPTFSAAAGTYASAQMVTISSTTNGASFRYTTDGSTPTDTNGTVYSGPISVNSTTMLKAIAYVPGVASDSPVTSGLYSITTAPAISLNVIYDFTGSGNGGIYPYTNLLQASDGNFYGTTYTGGFGLGSVFKVTPGGAFTTVASFNGSTGTSPNFENLIQDGSGNIYGTTGNGGASNDGTVFELTPAGALSAVASFTGTSASGPQGLVQGNDGNFYGTTEFGGSANDGTVFKVTPAGVLTTLVSFNSTTGIYPNGLLVQGSDGNFYGTTYGVYNQPAGTVFKVTPAGILTTLVTFNGLDGEKPSAGLVQGSDGNFYGTTRYGGSAYSASPYNPGYGTIFRMTPAGVLTTLVSFTGLNGAAPAASMIVGSDGNFYGTTSGGGSTYGTNGGTGFGTAFMMTPAGVLTTLVSFTGPNGSEPYGSLTQGSDGNFYGTTEFGGIASDGVIFQLILPH